MSIKIQDPIEEATDKQARSRYADRDFSCFFDEIMENEEDLINAIDLKRKLEGNRDLQILWFLSKGYTQEEVGEMFGLTKQRVGQIKKSIKNFYI